MNRAQQSPNPKQERRMPTHLLVVRMSFTPQLKKRNVLEDLSNHCAPNQLGSLKNLLLSLLDEMNDTSSL